MRRSIVSACLVLATAISIGRAQAQPILHFGGQNATIDILDYSFTLSPKDKGLRLTFTDKDAQRIRDFFQTQLGKEVSLTIGGKATLLPIVRAAPTGNSLALTLGDRDEFAAVAAAMAAPDQK